jgi:zeaxanthin glucosyltransferase
MTPTTVGILPLAEPGHVNATIQLGRELQRAGHRVRYLGDPADQALFVERGVPFAPLPRRDGRFGPTYAWAANDDEIALVDAILIRPTIDACNAGKRVVSISTTFPLGYDPDVPPVTCDRPPATDAAARAAIHAAWEAQWQDHRAVKDPHPHVGRADSTLHLMRSFARDRGWADDQWDERAAINPIARLPELILAPEQLDFPRRANPQRRYGGPCVNLDRPEPPFPFALLSDQRPVVYCSFGSQTHRYPLPDLLAVLVRTCRQLPALRFVVATGGVDVPPDAQPPNLICVQHAPQLALLRRAALMISHGGLNGIKEALYCGVPVLVLPLLGDQPGNAARIAFHGLGTASTWDGMTPARLAGLVHTLLADAATARRARELGARLRDAHERPASADALAELLPLAIVPATGAR